MCSPRFSPKVISTVTYIGSLLRTVHLHVFTSHCAKIIPRICYRESISYQGNGPGAGQVTDTEYPMNVMNLGAER